MAAGGACAQPWLEWRRDLERREIAGKRRRRADRSFLFLAVRGDVWHGEALRGTLRTEMEPRLPLDRERDASKLRHGTGLHDRAAVGPDRDRYRRGRGERGGPAAGRDEHTVGTDVAARSPNAGDAVALA